MPKIWVGRTTLTGEKKVEGLINFNMPFQLVLTKLNCFRVYRKSDHVIKSCKEAIGHDVAVAQFVCISRTCDFPRNFTAVTTNTRPQRFFSFGSNLWFDGRQSTVTMVFSLWPREDSFPVSRALGGTCWRLSHFRNILLQDLTPLHVKITKLNWIIDLFTHCKLQPHKLSQYTLATRLSSC